MKCPKCQHENPDTQKFCGECGAKLERVCPSCGSGNPPQYKFCGECGRNLTLPSEQIPKDLSFDEKIDKIQRYLPKGLTEEILAQRDKIEGECKQVTVMFCDMEGFTHLVEKLGPEETYGIMDQVYEILIHKVHDYEGTVNEMTGDGIMALFGAPIALEDAPQRAIRSSLSIHREMARFSDRMKEEREGIPTLKMRVGINTGPVVVGTLGNNLRVEFKAVGDTVNLASRMEGLAEPGTTFVTDDSFKLTEGFFRFEALGEKAIKGKKKAVPVYKLLSEKKEVYRPRLGAERMIYSEMVGRDKELNKVELQVMKAINGEGSIVNIIGEAGIGKSRLVAELKNRDAMKRVSVLEGRAISIGRNLSFHPIIDLFKQWARIKEDDGQRTAFDKLNIAVGSLYREGVDEVVPFVATLMGIELSGRYAERIKGIEGEALEKLILKNVREILIKATELTPLVVVTEDLHWADTSSIGLMESLFRLAETQRILFVNVFRQGHKETGERIITTIKERFSEYYIEIVLQPLDEIMSESLINNMLNIRELHHAVIDEIVKIADGNPFFIEEVVRSLIDEGALVVKGESFEVTEKIDTVVIPHTINDVLMARIDSLEEKTRHLVKIASVIGRNFFYRILAEVARTIEDIDSRLSYLKEIQLIRERKRMGELEYLFKHALAQVAAYESILRQQRKELHLKVANSIEKVFHERMHIFYGILAYHYTRGENEEKAEDYLIKAGEEALKSSASSEALNYYQEGLKLYLTKYGDDADPDKLAMFEKNIALAFFYKGQVVNALEYLDRVLERIGVRSSKNEIIVAFKLVSNFLNLIAHLYLPLKKSKRVPDKRDNEIFDLLGIRGFSLGLLNPKRHFIEYLSTIKRCHKFDIRKIENGPPLYIGTSSLFSYGGISFKLSKKILESAKDILNKEDLIEQLIYDQMELFHIFFSGGWHECKQYDEELVNHNLRVGQIFPASTYILVHGFMKIEQGAFREAEIYLSKLSEIWDVFENENARGYQYALKTKLLMKSRKLYDAQTEADAGVSFQGKIHVEPRRLYFLGFKAITQILLSDIDRAKKILLQAEEAVLKQGRVIPHFISSYLMGQFLFDLHILEQAVSSNDKSNIFEFRKKAYQSGKKALKNSRKYAADRTEIFRLVGLYYWLTGSQNKAVKWWKTSIEEGERLGARVEISRTYMEVGKRLLEKSSRFSELNGIEAEAYLEKARRLFGEMGLQWDLDELEKVTSYNHSFS